MTEGSARDDLDLLVIGGGAAGLAAARAGVRMNRRVTMVQDGPVGGDCTFTGCVPSKTLLESGAAGLDFAASMARVGETVARVAATETAGVLRDEGVDVVEDRAVLIGPATVRVGPRIRRASKIVIATGSSPARPAIAGLEHPDVLDSDSVWSITERPASLVVLGGGPVGCELADAFARFGTTVTVLEAADRLLPSEDAQASAVLAGVFDDRGIAVRCGVRVERVTATRNATVPSVRVEVDGGTVHAERLLVATGRTPSTKVLGAAAAGVLLDPAGHVVVDDTMATSTRGIRAAGDVTGRLLFTHAADEMGRIAVFNSFRSPLRMTLHERSIPRVVFTDPEIAQVGLTEAQAAATGGGIVAELPMSAVDRAVAAGRTEGFVKLIARTRLRSGALGRLVGATVVAPRAGEVIHELALAVRTGLPVFRLAQTVHAYPTWSTAVRSAAAQFLFEVDGRAARPAVTSR